MWNWWNKNVSQPVSNAWNQLKTGWNSLFPIGQADEQKKRAGLSINSMGRSVGRRSGRRRGY
jgi:hypothetical protein